jgi:hypothetical protein
MEIEKLKKLQTEYRKFSSARFPSDVKSLVIQSQSIQLQRPYPITDEDSPLVVAFCKITGTPNIPGAQALAFAMADVITLRVFQGPALSLILESFASFILTSEPDLCIRVLQAGVLLLRENIAFIPAAVAIFSLSFQLLKHELPVIQKAACVTVQEHRTDIEPSQES